MLSRRSKITLLVLLGAVIPDLVADQPSDCRFKQLEGFERLLSAVGYDPFLDKRDRCRALSEIRASEKMRDESYSRLSVDDSVYRAESPEVNYSFDVNPVSSGDSSLVVRQIGSAVSDTSPEIDQVRGYSNRSGRN
jgi:hypothetical protein